MKIELIYFNIKSVIVCVFLIMASPVFLLPQTVYASYEVNLISPPDAAPADTVEVVGNAKATDTVEVIDKTKEIWLRLKSRFKTSEIEIERKKYGRALASGGQSIEVALDSSDVTGEISAGSGEINLSPKGSAATAEVISAGPKTAEVKIETGENLFYRHCYSCHFDHSHFKTARILAGRDFWLKYNSAENNDGIISVIRSGRRTVSGDMPSYPAQRLSEKEAAAIIEHLKTIVQPLNVDEKTTE